MSNRMPLSKQRSRGYKEEVARYLTLAGTAPALPPEEQDQLFFRLRVARIALEQLVLNSSAWRARSGGQTLTPGFLKKDWTLATTERICSQLLAYAERVSDPAVTHLALEAEAFRKVIHASREKAIEANLRLVCNVALAYQNRGLDLLDVIQAGNIGLMKGVWYYDLARGYRFSTYGRWWIYQSIARAIALTGRTIVIPQYIRRKMGGVVSAERKLTKELGRKPTTEEIAKLIGGQRREKTLVQEIEKIRAYFLETISLDAPLGDEPGDELLADTLVDQSVPGPERSTDYEQLQQLIQKLLAHLSPKQETVLRKRFGLGYKREYTLKEVGDAIGVTRERIRQIEKGAMHRARYIANKIGLKSLRRL